jgi:hypothetical protein
MADHSDEASYIQLTASIVSPTFSTTGPDQPSVFGIDARL